MVYWEDKCFRWNGDECGEFRQVLVTYPLDATDDVVPHELTPVEKFDGAHRPRWSWDQAKIAFHAFPQVRLGRSQIYTINPDGTGLTQLTFEDMGQNGARSPSWSPGNSQILYVSDREAFAWDIWIMNSNGSGKQNLTKGKVKFPGEPKFSPDARHILFYAHDDETGGDRRSGPDFEIWIMNRDGSDLRKITNNDRDDENPVWGLNGVDVVFSADDQVWEAVNALTSKPVFEFPGLAEGEVSGRYISPVLAATAHVLLPAPAAIEAQVVDERGYVDPKWLAEKLETSPKLKGYQVTTPSNDPISGIRYEIFTAFTQTPIYQSNVGGWVPPVISW